MSFEFIARAFGEPMAWRYVSWLLQGFGVTLAVSAWVCAAASLLGLLICALRFAPGRWLPRLARGYVGLFRNTPLLVQLFFWYFGASALLPSALMAWLNTPHTLDLVLFGIRWPAFETLAGFFGLTLYMAAFISEEFRAGINGVKPSQREAALALGLTPRAAFFLVILPQTLRIALLPLLGQYMNTIKNTSLTMAIGLAELSYASRQVETETFLTFQAFGIATLLYVAVIALIEAAGQAIARSDSFGLSGAGRMNFAVITDNLGYLLVGAWPQGPIGGAALTLILATLSALLSAVIGLVLGIALSLACGRLRTALVVVLGFFRAIPVIMLIFWTYFLLPILFRISVPEIGTVVCALSLIGGSYLAFGVAAGIDSIGTGQWAAGAALGLTRLKVLRLIILPQALPAMAPSFINQWVALTKDTSLAYVVGVPELSLIATQVNNRAMVHPTEVFLFVGALYWLMCIGLDLAASRLLRRKTAKH